MNQTKHRLEHGEVVVGGWVLSGSPRVAEVLARTDVDWLAIDTEHAPYGPERIEAIVRAIEPAATPLVRLPSVEAAVAGAAKRALDVGAHGIIVPGIESATEAERVVAAAKFPPAGERGVAGTVRANDYGQRFGEYVESANDETILVVQIESPPAVERVDEILAVDGIDVAFTGENDLSAAFGRPGQKDHHTVVEAVDTVLETAQAHDVYPGIAGRTPTAMARRIDRGFQWFLLGADLSFARAGIEPFLEARLE